MWFCWEHPTLSQVYCCFVSASKYHKVHLLPDPFSLQHLNVFSGIMTCAIPEAAPWALFYVETVCSRSAGNRVETMSLCKESSSYSWLVPEQRQANVAVPNLKSRGKRAGFVSQDWKVLTYKSQYRQYTFPEGTDREVLCASGCTEGLLWGGAWAQLPRWPHQFCLVFSFS